MAQSAAQTVSPAPTTPSSVPTTPSSTEVDATPSKAASQADHDPYVVYALRPPHERAAPVVPRIAKQPDLSPANYRFSRVMSNRSSLKDMLPTEYLPRWDSFASSDVTESSFAWSEWTRGTTKGQKREVLQGTPEDNREMGIAQGLLDQNVPFDLKRGGIGTIKGPALVEELAPEAQEIVPRAVSSPSTEKTNRKMSTRNQREQGSTETPAQQKEKRKVPRDSASAPRRSDAHSPTGNEATMVRSNHSDGQANARRGRLKPLPALRKFIRAPTLSAIALSRLLLFSRSRRTDSETTETVSAEGSQKQTPKRATRKRKKRKSDSSPHLSSRADPSESSARDKRGRHSDKPSPRKEKGSKDPVASQPKADSPGTTEGGVTPPSQNRKQIRLADVGNLLTGTKGTLFHHKRATVSREERVERVSAWQAQNFDDHGQAETPARTRDSVKRKRSKAGRRDEADEKEGKNSERSRLRSGKETHPVRSRGRHSKGTSRNGNEEKHTPGHSKRSGRDKQSAEGKLTPSPERSSRNSRNERKRSRRGSGRKGTSASSFSSPHGTPKGFKRFPYAPNMFQVAQGVEGGGDGKSEQTRELDENHNDEERMEEWEEPRQRTRRGVRNHNTDDEREGKEGEKDAHRSRRQSGRQSMRLFLKLIGR